MLTFDELWKRLCDLDETVQIEAKAGEQVGPSILETISAFSNEPGRGGGYLILGVRPVEASLFAAYEVIGVTDADRVQAELATQCRTLFNRPIRPSIQVEMRNGKRVIVAFVPEADAHDKPVYIDARGLPKGAFRRIGSTDQKCTDDDLTVFFQGRSTKRIEDSIVDDADVSDFDPKALDEYRTGRARLNPGAAELQFSDEELLRALGAATRVDGQLRPTLAGLTPLRHASRDPPPFPCDARGLHSRTGTRVGAISGHSLRLARDLGTSHVGNPPRDQRGSR